MRTPTLPTCFLLLATLALDRTCAAQWQSIASGTTDSLTAVTWVDDRFMIAGGGLTFLHSMDDGLSFTATAGYAFGLNGSPLDHLSFHDAMVGYGTSVWNCCTYQYTTDGGVTWQTSLDPGDRTRMRIALDAENQVIFKGGAGVQFNTSGLLLNEPDGFLFADLDSVCPVPNTGNCWESVIGTDTTYTTGSYGWTFTSIDQGASIQSGTFPYANYLYAARRVNDSTIAYLDFDAVLRVSHDRGLSWQRRSTPPMTLGIISPAFAMYDAATGALVDSNGQINLTADSGLTWTPVPTPTTQALNDLLYVSAQNLLAVGDGGTILTSSDGGNTWEIEDSGTTERLHALATSGSATIAIGTNGTILRRFPAHAGLSIPTGVAAASPSTVELFPNPSTDVLNVRFAWAGPADPPSFRVTDALGRNQAVRAQFNGSDTWGIDVTGLAHGVHVLHAKQGDFTWERTFLVVK